MNIEQSNFDDQNNINNTLILLELSDACLWYVSKDFKLLAFNKHYSGHMHAFANIIPSVGDEDAILAHFPPDFSARVMGMYQLALSGEIVKSMEKGFDIDGSTADIIMVFKPVKNDNNEVIGVACMRRDISEYVQIKEQLDEKKEIMKYITWQQSHTVRGPLSTAMGIASLLEDKEMFDATHRDDRQELIHGLNQKLQDLDKIVREIVENSEAK